MANCPICGRHLGTYTNDPILTTPSLSTEDYEGFTTLISTHIKELQIERHQQEIDNGITPLTEFSPINDAGLFQNIIKYITELRDSTEKILTATGSTLVEFLSTDEDGNPMILKTDWTDSKLEEKKFQCKTIHIEDLRHYISLGLIYLFFQSTELNELGQFKKYWVTKNSQNILNNIKVLSSSYTLNESDRASIDKNYIYEAKNSGTSAYLYVYNKTTLVQITTILLGVTGSGTFVYKTRNDLTHVYIYGQGNFSDGYKTKVWKIQKEDLTQEPPLFWSLVATSNSSSIWYDIALGKNYVYLIRTVHPIGTSDYLIIEGEDYQLYTAYAYMAILNKSNLLLNHYWSSSHYNGEHFVTLPSNFTIQKFINTLTPTDIYKETLSCDSTYIYGSIVQYAYNKSGDIYEKDSGATIAGYYKNILTVTEGSSWISLKSLSESELLKYYHLVIDNKYVFGLYWDNISPYYYLIAWNKTDWAEDLKTNSLVYDGFVISIGGQFWTICTNNQYLFAS